MTLQKENKQLLAKTKTDIATLDQRIAELEIDCAEKEDENQRLKILFAEINKSPSSQKPSA